MEALRDITVLELAFYYPGPLCGLLLSDMGATVIKIESSEGDPLRPIGATGGASTGPSFKVLNRGKKSVCMDLKSEQGRQAFLSLVQTADVLLQVFRPAVMDRLGLGADRIRECNGRLVHCIMTGYGMDDPWAQRAGHDLNYESLAGITAMTGLADGTLALPGVPLADLSGGLLAALAIVGALRERDGTGTGRVLDVSLTDAALFSNMLNVLGGGFGSGELAPGRTLLTGRIPAYNIYRSSDGRAFALGALEPKFWVRFVTAAGCPELMPYQFDPEHVQSLRDVFASRDSAHWLQVAQATDVCLEPVLMPDQVASHPLHEARGIIIEAPDGQLHMRMPGIGSPAQEKLHSPDLGEHTGLLTPHGGT